MNLDHFGMDTITLAGPLEAKLRAVRAAGFTQIMLSARELNSESLPNRTWINERLTFTHGYGLTLGPVNEVTREGLPILFVRDLPPQSDVDIAIEEPSIYFGELSSDHVQARWSSDSR